MPIFACKIKPLDRVIFSPNPVIFTRSDGTRIACGMGCAIAIRMPSWAAQVLLLQSLCQESDKICHIKVAPHLVIERSFELGCMQEVCQVWGYAISMPTILEVSTIDTWIIEVLTFNMQTTWGIPPPTLRYAVHTTFALASSFGLPGQSPTISIGYAFGLRSLGLRQGVYIFVDNFVDTW